MKCKVYVAKLKRAKGDVKCVYKVGITKSPDAMSRINYRSSAELYPITNYFTDNKIMKTVWCESVEEAERLEKHLMDSIRGNQRFHNWWEKDPISGITEMRKWNYEEFQKVCALIEEYKSLQCH